jgi:hypothetical protein
VNQSDIYYWLGIAQEASENAAAARESWERAALHRGDFHLMRVTSFSEMSLYNALAMMRLGRQAEAAELLRNLLAHAEGLKNEEPKIDYFATSLPQMLLFEDDAAKRNEVTATFLEAQARLGLGDVAASRKLLDRVLELDCNHAGAADLVSELEFDSLAARG